MKPDEQGQISIEFILILGAVLTMAIVAIPMVLKSAEMNRGVTAARDGATKGAAMRGLGFSATTDHKTGVVKIINLTSEYNGTSATGLEKYRLRFYVKMSDGLDKSSVCTSIRQAASSNLNYAFAGKYTTSFAAVDGSYYSFTTACTPVS
ncbi:MAG TPA: class III signal peptide-containing protein [Euryarchaeota archaeon]|nr:class III signal peptide-containing protein [Euryarchaeota archaeon]